MYGHYDGVILKNVGDEFGGNIKNPINDFIPFAPNQIKSATANNGDYSAENNDFRFRTSEELNDEYGSRWIDEQTNEDGRHSTQVQNTLNSYRKFGEWVKADSQGREVSVLDASSGLGLGTEWMRENGIDVDDVEPYPSESRTAPTYRSYDDIDKEYDYIISNAVLNVLPDDWRADVLHEMAGKLKVGGKLVINVRSAKSIEAQGREGKTKTTLDSPSEILVTRPDGSIRAYQKGFTKQELKEWCESELGEGYSVEIATRKNAGDTYDTAVVVTKRDEGAGRFRGPVGGNSGYIGYSMSKRAAEAREEGRFPKGDFCKEYGVSRAHFDTLVKAGVIDNSEWHHTSSYGNRTEFYEWAEPAVEAVADMFEQEQAKVAVRISLSVISKILPIFAA
jgi:2-polyprenyl-3-methyl-5-hydroxy-6-metoxy-1,4-benzoquinol methylase